MEFAVSCGGGIPSGGELLFVMVAGEIVPRGKVRASFSGTRGRVEPAKPLPLGDAPWWLAISRGTRRTKRRNSLVDVGAEEWFLGVVCEELGSSPSGADLEISRFKSNVLPTWRPWMI